MSEFSIEVRRTVLQIAALAGWTIVSCWWMGRGELVPGLVLGNFASIVYFLLMAHRIRKSMDMPVEKAVTSMRVGWILRLSFIVCMLLISLNVPKIQFLAAVGGLFSFHIILFVNAVLFIVKNQWMNLKKTTGKG